MDSEPDCLAWNICLPYHRLELIALVLLALGCSAYTGRTAQVPGSQAYKYQSIRLSFCNHIL